MMRVMLCQKSANVVDQRLRRGELGNVSDARDLYSIVIVSRCNLSSIEGCERCLK
jgi:hypothetical protein